jgi:hypothetical protein
VILLLLILLLVLDCSSHSAFLLHINSHPCYPCPSVVKNFVPSIPSAKSLSRGSYFAVKYPCSSGLIVVRLRSLRSLMFVKIRANSCLPDLQFIRTDPNSTARSESLIFPRSSFHSASFRVVCGSTSVVSFSFSCVSHISRLKISVFIRPHPWLKFWDHRRSRRTGPGRLADGYRTGSTLTIAR